MTYAREEASERSSGVVSSTIEVLDLLTPINAFVPPASIEDILIPGYYAPEFLDLKAQLARGANFRKLSEICDIRSAGNYDPHHIPTWAVTVSPNSIEVLRCWNVDPDVDRPRRKLGLPPRAIILPEIYRGGTTPIFFWDESIFNGKANISGSALILVPFDADKLFPAIADAIRGPLVQQQIARLVAGFSSAMFPRIPLEYIGQILIPESLEERNSRHVMAVAGAKLQANPSGFTVGAQLAERQLMLTAATDEERIGQLETFLKGSLPEGWIPYYIQASTNNAKSNLYTIRELRSGRYLNLTSPVEEHESDDLDFLAWNQWYWSTIGESSVQLFNSYLRPSSLPHAIWLRLLEVIPVAKLAKDFVLPRWREVAELWASHAESESNAWDDDLADLIASHGQTDLGVALSLEDIASSYRPVVGVRIDKDGEPSGAFLLLGDDQRRDPEGAGQRLLSFGMTIHSALGRTVNINDSIVRQESIRRMSWIMHQLASPLMRLDNKLKDIQDWLASKPEMKLTPIPDEERAANRATHNCVPISEYTLGAVVDQLQGASDEIRALRYKVRRFKNAHRDPRPSLVRLEEFCARLASSQRDRISGLRVQVDVTAEPLLFDPEPIAEALEEVIENALRELSEQKVENPTLDLSIHDHAPWVVFTIRDNALKAMEHLVANPFEEGVSTYQQKNKGTGIGLAATKAAFVQQGGTVELRMNTAPDGERMPGVTFVGRLPRNVRGATHA